MACLIIIDIILPLVTFPLTPMPSTVAPTMNEKQPMLCFLYYNSREGWSLHVLRTAVTPVSSLFK